MSTPQSASVPYATPQQFCNLYDFNSLGRMLFDDHKQHPIADVLVSPVLLQALMAASGRVEAVCTVASSYTPADLENLTGNSAQLLAEMVCGLAMLRLWVRRPDPSVKMPIECQQALADLKELRTGSMIFGIQEHATAGLEKTHSEHPRDVFNRRMVTTQAERLFGPRSNVYPYPNEG
jgi:hypothetical protein